MGAALAIMLALIGGGMAMALSNMVNTSAPKNTAATSVVASDAGWGARSQKHVDMRGPFKEAERRPAMLPLHWGSRSPGKPAARMLAWTIASHIEEARNYTGMVVRMDVQRGLVAVNVSSRIIVFKLNSVYVNPRTGNLVLGNWIAGSLTRGSTVTITGLGFPHLKLALAIYEASGTVYMVPQYYAVQASG